MVKLKRSPFKDMKVKFTIFLSSYCFRGIFSRFNSHSSDIKLISHSTQYINSVTKCSFAYSRNLSWCNSIVTVKQSVTSDNSISFCRLTPGQGYSRTMWLAWWKISTWQGGRCIRRWQNKGKLLTLIKSEQINNNFMLFQKRLLGIQKNIYHSRNSLAIIFTRV